MSHNKAKNGLRRPLLGGGRISASFRNYNIALFALAFFLMMMALLAAFYNIVEQISADYARRYATSSANALSAHIATEIAILSNAARSRAVIDWLTDEGNHAKKILAYEKLSGIIRELHSGNLYIGFAKSLHEYKIVEDYAAADLRPFAVLDKNNPDDAWFFNCLASDENYMLSVGIDRVLQRKRVWLDYKIVHNGVALGVICTGLDFSQVVMELFSYYDSIDMRGFIIDRNGVINMDSSLLGDDDFLRHDFEARIEDKITNPAFLAALRSHLDSIDGYFEGINEPVLISLSFGPHRYATISPIRHTDWSVVILYDSSSLLGMSLFLPVFATTIFLLIAFALTTNTISHQLIFSPLEQLIRSLARLKENKEARIYGIERDDEFGDLSNTIQDLFTKANYDALTGIYNRRFMENNLERIMKLLSRSNGLLSVLMLDVDYFKKYNDTYGHEQGDACLKSVAKTLAGSITRTNDFAARYGGEEFVAVLPNTDEAGARMLAQKLLENVRMLNIPHASSTATQCVTVSIGVTTGKVAHKQNWTNYVKCADKALYMSKQNGRNQYTYLNFIQN